MTDNPTPPPDMARLRWQCRRGMLELDEILLRYLEGPFLAAPQAQQQQFRALLQIEDPVLNQWLILGHPPEQPQMVAIVGQIRHHKGPAAF